MATYTQLQQEDIQFIAQQYQLDIQSVEPIKEGSNNSNFKLYTKQGLFIATLSEARPIQEIRQLAELIDYLHFHGIKTNSIQRTKDQAFVTELKGKPLFVKNYIEGGVIESLSLSMIREVGRTMGKFHNIAPPPYLTTIHDYERAHYEVVLHQDIDPQYGAWLQQISASLSKLIERYPLQKGCVHGDLFTDNMLFHQGKLQAFIDFEDTCYHHLVLDIGMTLIGTCRINLRYINFELAAEFLRGYQEERSLTHHEILMIQVYMIWSAVQTSKWRFWKYRMHAPWPERADWHTHMVDLANYLQSISPDECLTKLGFD